MWTGAQDAISSIPFSFDDHYLPVVIKLEADSCASLKVHFLRESGEIFTFYCNCLVGWFLT